MLTVIVRLAMSQSDFDMLDDIAAAAGKTRDQFVLDYVQQMIWMERVVRKRNQDHPGGDAA